ncbi:MAG: nucleotide exchange factor GrpE [Candidatus Moraniibacteriota bacterium]
MLKKKTEQQEKNWESLFITQKLILWHPEEKKFLLVKAIHNKHGEVWGRLGGHLEKSEVTLDGLKREVMEEAGNIDYEVISIIDTARAELNPSLLSISYLALYKGGDIQLSDEHVEYKWFTAEEVEQNETILPSLKRVTRLAVDRLKEREYLNDLKRLQADFENYKRRQAETQKEMKNFLIEQLVLDIIPVLDNFRSANAHIPEAAKSEPWVVGVQYIEKQLEDVLTSNGMQIIDVKEGDVFDPNIHEAVSQVEVNEEKQEGGMQAVAKVLQKGYKLGEKIVRPAKVIVA